MKQRILEEWNFKRALYVALGIFIIVQSILEKQWFGIFFGGYFASMGIFRFGCASGQCYSSSNLVEEQKTDKDEIFFEEVKNK